MNHGVTAKNIHNLLLIPIGTITISEVEVG